MTTLLIVLCIIGSIALGFVILIQKPKGGGLSGAFGSVGAQVMGVKQSGDATEKATWYIMAAIAILCIISVFTLQVVHTQPQQQQQEQPGQNAQQPGQQGEALPVQK
ncbi:MAG TPA: preprotein translocase subunit SecG [Edaphocola sp.]|nr:preprotein translocase subunit SecG [Edaphocola sp.]